MKKTYSSIKLFIALFSLAAINFQAQLSGVYTINGAVPTGGNNFQTFTAFRTALVSGGVTGPVTVNVVLNSGPYLEQVSFPQITGMNATNTVTINGNGNTISFNSSNSLLPHTIAMGGGDFFTFNNLIVEGSGTYAYAVHIWNDSDNNTFNGCQMIVPLETTSSNHIPYSLSGSADYYGTSGNTGDNNLVTNCTLRSGYFGVCMYGITSSPFNTNNRVENSLITDWYVYGAYIYYQRQMALRANTINRPTRANLTTTYGIYTVTGTLQAFIEKNRIQQLFEGNPGYAATVYGIRIGVASTTGIEHIVRNNLVKIDKKGAGTVYGIYVSNVSYANLFHNTIVSDDQTINGSYTFYGVFGYGTNLMVKNNNIALTDIGTGTRYGLYFNSTMGVGNAAGNNVYRNCPSATTYHGYYSGNQTTLANWQSINGFGVNGYATDPLFVNPNNNDYRPASYVMNNGGVALGVTEDILSASRSMTTPDAGAWEYFNVPCSGPVPTNTAITPANVICPNSPVNLYLANTFTTSGMTYSWQASSTSPVGPWNVVPPGILTNAALNTTVGTQVLWYSAVLTCTNGMNNTTTIAGSVNVAGTTTNTVPYFEGFENITGANKLPNCSWTASNIGNTCFTSTMVQTNYRMPRTGNAYANFFYSPSGNNYFWSNGIQLNAGVTYSISTWFMTEYYGYVSWDLNLWVGPSQNTVAATKVATTGGAAASASYKSLSNTFTVATSGIYYVGIHGFSSGACCANYLSWDDLQIIAPCVLNTPPVAINSVMQTLCAGQSLNLTALGANTYVWNTGATTNNILVSPSITTVYSVVGTNAGSGCAATVNQQITVYPTPNVSILAPSNSVCAGSSLILSALGANSYTWNNGSNAAAVSISPMSNTSYSVLGANTQGCIGSSNINISVSPLPTVLVNSSNSGLACADDETILTGSGASTYYWSSNSGVSFGNSISVSPNNSIIYTLVGVSVQGCSNTATYELEVTACTGITKINSSNSGVKLYPNPNNGIFTIEWNNKSAKSAEVIDITGRVIVSTTTNEDHLNINLGNFANGVYYVKLLSDNSSDVIKIVKE